MKQSKQRVNDSFSVFLRNIKKKDGSSGSQSEVGGDPIEVLKLLQNDETIGIEQLADALHVSAYNAVTIVKNLESSGLVKVEPETGLVSLTPAGLTIAKYQDLLAK